MVTTDRKYSVSVSFPSSLLERMDKERGKIPRSTYLVELVEKSFRLKK